eukprot:1144660-Pelagomonas_calceolata.AAC.7
MTHATACAGLAARGAHPWGQLGHHNQCPSLVEPSALPALPTVECRLGLPSCRRVACGDGAMPSSCPPPAAAAAAAVSGEPASAVHCGRSVLGDLFSATSGPELP